MLKKGISYWAFSGKSYKQAFEYAKKSGFDGVEITIDDGGELNPESSDEKVLEIKAQAKEAGIELYSVATGFGWSYPFTANEPEIREKGIKIVRRQLEIAKLLGCDSILVVPALVTEDVPYDVAYERAFDAVKELSVYAEQLGVVIGVENVWNKFLLSPLEYRDFIDKIGFALCKGLF